MKDPYQVLGVPRSAGQADIKAAYRRLAKELHPDRNPGNPRGTERFKEVSAAYHILGDEKLKARFDAGEIDASGAERQRGFQYAHGRAGGAGGAEDIVSQFRFGGDVEDILGDIFSTFRRGGAGAAGQRRPGADRQYSITISFLEATRGGKRRITFPGDDKTLEVSFPAGIDDGQKIRLKGQGEAGAGARPGDALIEIRVEPHPFFTRKGHDVHVELPVTLSEAILGARINAPTIDGMVALSVPKGSNSGTQLRLRGKGIKDPATGRRGDQYVKLRVVLPERPDADLERFVKSWRAKNGEDVRRDYRID